MKNKKCKACPQKNRQSIEKINVQNFKQFSETDSKSEVPTDEELICVQEEGEPLDFDISTTGNVLQHITKDPKRNKRPWAGRIRYENLVPCDVTNDHQYRASTQKKILDEKCNLTVTSEPNWKRQTGIIATIEIFDSSVEQIELLLESGMDIARIDLACGNRCDHSSIFRNLETAVKNFVASVGFPIPIARMVDLKGPRVRTGRICRSFVKNPTKPEIFLERGSSVKLIVDTSAADQCTPENIFVDFDGFPKLVRPNMKIYMGNGVVKLTVNSVVAGEVNCIVQNEGTIGNHEDVHVPMVPLPLPCITDDDIIDIELAIEEEIDFIAVSQVRNASVIRDLKGVMVEKMLVVEKIQEKPIMILAKISNFDGLNNIDEIISAADGIIIERTDLGLEIPSEKITVAQREIIAKCNVANKPVICCLRLTKSNPSSRMNNCEIFDVAGCVFDGADCISLTKLGDFPNETVEQINHILREAEAATMQRIFFRELTDKLLPPVEPKIAVGMAACLVAEKIRASAVIVLTSSGKSAQIVSWFKPRCIVIAVSRYERTARQMNLHKAVVPLYFGGPKMADWCVDAEQRFQYGIAYGKEIGFVRCGDPVVLVSGYGRDAGFTNCLRIIYTTTEPSIFLEHSKEYYDNLYLEGNVS